MPYVLALIGSMHWVLSEIDRGFDFSVLSEFRTRLIAGNAEYLLFEAMLTCLKQRGLIKAGGRQRDFRDACAGGSSCHQSYRLCG